MIDRKSKDYRKLWSCKKVRPEIIVEILFDSISESKRHKSGIAVRFSR